MCSSTATPPRALRRRSPASTCRSPSATWRWACARATSTPPWPEEFNRQAVDILAEYYFAPTEASKKNLLDEGKPEEKIWVTGNTGIDAL